MALTAYIAATNRLLQNPVPANPLYTSADLTVYINQARQQLAGEAECIRADSAGALVAAQRNYLFTIFTVFTSGNTTLTGIASALTIRQMGVQVGNAIQPLTARPWPWFYRYNVQTGAAAATGTPSEWSQQGRGSKGTFAVSPIPTGVMTVFVDAACLPVDLADDTTPEALPAPFTTAIPYYAAYLAYLSSQRRDDATVMLGRYKEFVQRAVQETAGTVFPNNQPGGMGAQIAATRQTQTQAPSNGQGGR